MFWAVTVSDVREADLRYLRALAAHSGADSQALEPPVERFIEVNRLKLRYLEWGSTEAPPLVLLHGGGQSARTWDACCLTLARRYRCFALDQRGHGDSGWPEQAAYDFDDHAADVAGFIAMLGLRLPMLVGMSMGGINGIATATRADVRLRGLVCVDVGPDLQFDAVDRLLRGLGAYRFFDSPAQAASRMSALGARRDPVLLEATLRHNLRRHKDGRWTWKYDPRTLSDLTTAEILDPRQALWPRLQEIRCPVLVVRGADSKIFSPANAEKLAHELPDGRCVTVAAARHSVQTDNPGGLAAAIMSFDKAL